jgi:hypothetical protein
MHTLLRLGAIGVAALFCTIPASLSQAAGRTLFIDSSTMGGKTVLVQVDDAIILCLRDQVSANKDWYMFGWEGDALDLDVRSDSALFISRCPSDSTHAANFRARQPGDGKLYVKYAEDAVPRHELRVLVSAP